MPLRYQSSEEARADLEALLRLVESPPDDPADWFNREGGEVKSHAEDFESSGIVRLDDVVMLVNVAAARISCHSLNDITKKRVEKSIESASKYGIAKVAKWLGWKTVGRFVGVIKEAVKDWQQAAYLNECEAAIRNHFSRARVELNSMAHRTEDNARRSTSVVSTRHARHKQRKPNGTHKKRKRSHRP